MNERTTANDRVMRVTEPPAERLLGSRRGALLFVLLIFVTTAIQVLAVPIVGLMGAGSEWPLPVAVPIGLLILVLGCAAQAGALLLSDRWPRFAVLLAVGTYLALALGLAVPSWLVGMYLVIALAQFLLATRCSALVSVLWAAGVIALSMVALFSWVLAIGTTLNFAIGFVSAEAVRFAAPIMGATALGIWWRAQARRIALIHEEAEQAKQEHSRRVAEAQALERARIAQELHDVAGQHLAGLITLADAALTIASARPDQALGLIEEVRNEGRFASASLTGALSDMRATGSEPVETTPDLRRVPELVDYWRHRGMSVQVESSGTLADLPAVVSTTAYRCVQEALTNAAKHAPGAPVSVSIRLVPTQLSVSVHNAPASSDVGTGPALGLGWGLTNMRERVSLLQGRLSTTTTEAGGWLLSFEIPFTPTIE